MIKKVLNFCLILILFFESAFFIFTQINKANAQGTGGLFYADSEIPIVLPRSVWNNSDELNGLMSWTPQNETLPSDWQPVERIILHDTATPNNDPLSGIARMQSIYKFHAVTNGWGDIGYNYLIGQDGKIYEGRLGGNGSRGAHAFNSKTQDNFNYGSIGISLIGSYAVQSPPAVQEESLSRLIGWLCAVNNLNPLEIQKTFSIWNAQTKSFSSSYAGPVIVGHKDVDKIKSDPASLDFSKIRQKAETYRQKYLGIIYQSQSNSKIYELSGGARKAFETIQDYQQKGGVFQKIATISQDQLDIFSPDRFLRFPNGSLIRFAESPTIYIIEEGKKRPLNITSTQFGKLGFDWAKVQKVTSGQLSLYSEGVTIVYGPDKELLREPGGKVFYIENGKKRWVTSGQLFGALGYSWKKVKDKSADYMATILEGPIMNYPTGTLAKGSGVTVYLFENGQKREFLSGQSFLKLGYQWNKIVTLADEELARYPLGQFVGYKDGTIVRADIDPAVYKISGGQKYLFISAEQFLNTGNQWKNILAVSSGELERYGLGGNVSYPDGTLVQAKSQNNVYRIQNGTAELIPDIATFNKLKLSWSKVLKISVDDFGKLFGAAAPSAAAPPATPSTPTTPMPAPTTTQLNVRVAIWNVPVSQTEVVFRGNGPYDVYDKSGKLLASKSAGEQFSVNVANPAGAFAKLVPKSGTILEIVSYQDKPAWKPSLNYNQFRGNLELVYSQKSGKLWVVNDLPLEEYLKGVAETNQGLNMEYLKTMAVAARTYAYNYAKQGGKYGADEVYYITNTTADQLYKGYGREPYASDIVTAVQATFGEMVVYNGNPIVTAYSSGAPELMSTGSRSACSVWGGKYCQAGYEYLAGGVKDPAGTSYSYDACGSGNHCVGLSGAGTRQMAALGKKIYREILMHYYPGTSVQKIY